MKTVASILLIAFLVGCSTTQSTNSGNERSSANQNGTNDFVGESIRVADGVSYILEDGEERHREFPDTFWIPSLEVRESLQKDQLVKLMFAITADGETQTERMWVIVREKTGDGYIGILDNDPYCTDKMKHGLEVRFQPRHVIHIYEVEVPDEDDQKEDQNKDENPRGGDK